MKHAAAGIAAFLVGTALIVGLTTTTRTHAATIAQADVDHDGCVTILDLSAIAAYFGQSSPPAPSQYDVDRDGSVSILDISAAAAYFSQCWRDKFKQPFASDSIWNTALGSGATLAPANIRTATGQGTFAEEIIIISKPMLPPVAFGLNTADWSGNSRCVSSGTQFMAPAPPSFRIPDSGGDDSGDHGGTPNHPSGVMTANGQSYIESQPLTHCANQPYTTHYWQTTSIYGDGINGSQGGSHMSGVGGTIRVGEWAAARTRGYFPHALKLVLDSANYSNSTGPDCSAPGCRWPATGSDCGNSACGYSGSNTQVKMGSLLTMSQSYNCAGLRTEPGRLYCRTLQLYGAYIVDSGFSTYYLPIEFSPDGDAGVEFQQQFGFAMAQQSLTNPWSLDVRDVMVNAQVVTNASATTPKGGGAPLLPNPPALGN